LAGQGGLVVDFEGSQWNCGQVWTGNHDNVCTLRGFVSTEHFSNQTLSKIPLHGTAHFPGCRNSKTCDRKLGWKEKDGHVSRPNPRSPFVNTLKISAPPDMFVAAERVPHGGPRGDLSV
jgi:hypothetical protein